MQLGVRKQIWALPAIAVLIFSLYLLHDVSRIVRGAMQRRAKGGRKKGEGSQAMIWRTRMPLSTATTTPSTGRASPSKRPFDARAASASVRS